jgi:hypothetical protein
MKQTSILEFFAKNSNIVFWFGMCYHLYKEGSMSEWLKEADCKSAASCYVGSNPTRPNLLVKNFGSLKFKFYEPVIVRRIQEIVKTNNKTPMGTKIRNFLIFNKFRKGVRITRIKPAKLLIKNRGNREIFVQKSSIKN